jgi:hypothetical protein
VADKTKTPKTIEQLETKNDELLEEAVKVVRRYDRVSTSLLQRTFTIGYARAEKLMDLLALKRVVAFSDGTSKPREVLSKKDNKKYNQCQSCGMPLKMDKNNSGSEMYCSSCYQNGAFKNPNITLEEMQNLVDDVLKNEMKWWKPFRFLAVRQIPTLFRWKRQ